MKHLFFICCLFLSLCSWGQKPDTLQLQISQLSKNLVACHPQLCIEYDSLHQHFKLYTYFASAKDVDFYIILNNTIYHQSTKVGVHIYAYYLREPFVSGEVILNQQVYYFRK